MTAIEEGARVTTICREYGIVPRTLFMRVGRNPDEAKRFTEAKQIRLARWHQEWLSEMHEHAKRSPWATAWLLERNFPELYALREFTRPVSNGSQPIGRSSICGTFAGVRPAYAGVCPTERSKNSIPSGARNGRSRRCCLKLRFKSFPMRVARMVTSHGNKAFEIQSISPDWTD